MPTTTNYIWDEENLLAEADGTNTIQTVYTNEPAQHGNLVSSRLPVTGTPTTVYHHFDAIGSTRQLTNTVGLATDTMIYDSWGNVESRTGTTPINPLWVGERGYYSDPETGLSRAGARALGPPIGRWTSCEPLGLRFGTNLYLYVFNQPCSFVDPSGLAGFRANMVAKSFINGPTPVGAIVPDRPGGPLPLWLSALLWPYLATAGVLTATVRLDALASVVGRLRAFNQNPVTDAKDQVYRLYTRIDVRFECCDDVIRVTNFAPDMEGGIELSAAELGIPGLPTVSGSIALSPLTVRDAPPDSKIIIWRGWGHPNPLVEPGIQFVAERTSINIWHKAEIWLTCKAGVGSYSIKTFTGSKFPSRRLWVNGALQRNVAQGSYSDLWYADPADLTFVRQ